MNTTTPTNQAPETFALPGGATCFVGIHIGNATSGLIFSSLTMFLPRDNFVGLLLLRQLLRRVLEHADLIASAVTISGPMQDCCLMVGVTDGPAAVEIIKPELEATGLLQFSQIGILDSSEAGRWRCVFPHASVNLNALMEDERHGLHFASLFESLRAGNNHAITLARLALSHPDLPAEKRDEFTTALQAAEQQSVELEKQIANLTHPETE